MICWKSRESGRKVSGRSVVAAAFTTVCLLSGVSAQGQVTDKGLPTGSNTQRSFADASIVRDSEINQPLDLLNDFYPAVEVTWSRHENVRRRSDVQEKDTKLTVLPSLGYRTNIGRHQFYAAYSGTFTYHDDLEQEDSRANRLNANLGLDVSRSWDLNLFAGIGESFEERGVSGSRPFNTLIIGPDTGPDEVEYDFYGADLVYGRKVSPLVGVVGYEKHTTSYTNNFQGDLNFSGNRDRETETVHLDLSYQVGSKTSVFGHIQRAEIDYQRAFNSLDSEQTDYLIGLRWKPSNALSGAVGVGRSEKDFDDPQRSDYDGSSYYANMSYMLNPFSILQLSASRIVEEPGDDRSDYYVSELLGIGWDHAINSDLVFSAFAKWVEDDYNTAREDEFFDFGFGLDYVWRPWLTAGIYYGEIERDSTLDLVEYDDRYYGIRIRSDLRPLLKGRNQRTEPESFGYPRASNRK